MGILSRTLTPLLTRGLETGPFPITSANIIEFLGGEASATGKRVSPEGALKLSAVWDCVDMVSRDVARTPVPLYRRKERDREKADETALYNLLHVSPNPFMTAFAFKQTLQGHKMLRGNAFANIERDSDGNPVNLWPLNPLMMDTPIISAAGTLLYTYHTPQGVTVAMTQDEVLHIRGLSNDGIIGYSPITMMRELVSLGMAYQEFAARFFGNNANPGGVLLAEKRLTEEAATRLKDSWETAHRGLEQAHRVAVLEEGIKWQQIGMALEDAQFVESSKLNRIEIASMWHIPAHKINELDRATFTNITEQDLDYEGSALDGEFAMWEQQLNMSLLTRLQQRRMYFEFTRNALVRSSIDKRFEAYQKAWWLTGNEIRERENLNSLEGFDQPLIPLNSAPLDIARELQLKGVNNAEEVTQPSEDKPQETKSRSIRKTADGWEITDGAK